MSDPLYKKELLRLAADAHGAGRLPHPNATGEAFNPTCGDKVIVDLALEDGRVCAMAHDTKACVLTQASASILGEALKGASHEDVEKLANDLAAMLVTKAAAPAPPFAAYAAFEGATEHRNRHRCVLLPVEAVLAAFDAGASSARRL
ncbi:MAG TPA: iron-sulfur cluster assembly scaffold protein [Rhizomicrobium sp.]|nr:iron-sulfur cluster assembly scaffold protein [Rhizomicrobium sp.]